MTYIEDPTERLRVTQKAQTASAAHLARIVNNPARVFNDAAREALAAVEGDTAMTEGRKPRKRASSSSAVARVIGCTVGQWHDYCAGSKSPTYRAMVGWLVKWEAAGYGPIELTISSCGSTSSSS